MKLKRTAAILTAFFLCSILHAQKINPADTTSAFRATQLIAPGALIGSGLAVHYFAHDTWEIAIRDEMGVWSEGHEEVNFDDFIQYAPLVLDLGLGLTGVKAEHCFLDRTIEAALAYASCGIINLTAKNIFKSERPNEANNQSFPSGHCATVFTGAELVRREYGWGWGAGAYGVATAVAIMRMYRNWHWFGDVLAGAGVGILSANIGCWLLQPTKNLFGIRLPDNLQFGFAPSVDPVSGSFCTALSVRF